MDATVTVTVTASAAQSLSVGAFDPQAIDKGSLRGGIAPVFLFVLTGA